MSVVACLSEVGHRYRPGAALALQPLSLTVHAGEAVGVMGPSGAGKSTLLNIIGLLQTPSEGHYRLMGRAAGKLGRRSRADLRAASIGFVFQSFHLMDGLTCCENIEMGLRYGSDGRYSRHEARARSTQLLEYVGLDGYASATPAQLSGGQQQRVAIARALVRTPNLILCDEPTGSLDGATAETVMELLCRTVSERAALVVVTHDEAVADRMDRVVYLTGGGSP